MGSLYHFVSLTKLVCYRCSVFVLIWQSCIVSRLRVFVIQLRHIYSLFSVKDIVTEDYERKTSTQPHIDTLCVEYINVINNNYTITWIKHILSWFQRCLEIKLYSTLYDILDCKGMTEHRRSKIQNV